MLIRESHQFGPVTGIAAGVVDDIQAAVFSDLKTGGIAEFGAVVKAPPLQHLVNQCLPANTAGIEILIPKRQIPDCRQQARRTYRVEVRNAQAEAAGTVG